MYFVIGIQLKMPNNSLVSIQLPDKHVGQNSVGFLYNMKNQTNSNNYRSRATTGRSRLVAPP